MANMRASLIIEARDRASAVFGRIADKSKALANSFKPMRKNAADADRAIDNIGRGSESRFRRIGAAAKRMANDFKLAERAGSLMGKAVGGVAGMAINAAKWGALAAGGGIGFFIGDMIRNASKFEQFQVMLENTEGSAAAAKRAMGWVTDFAAKTPYELDQVMQAFVALKAYGIDPTDGSLRSLGDAASGMNKDIMEAVEMLADAQTGEFERLKSFGIRARVEGEKVSFSYVKAGKDVVVTAKKSASEIQKALIGIFDGRFGGMMDKQSRTFTGLWSNLKDKLLQFELQIANAGIFDLLKAKAEAVLTKVDGWSKDGTLKRWAEQISASLEKMIERADNFISKDWSGATSKIERVASAVYKIADGILSVIERFEQFDRFTLKANAWVGKTFSGRPEERAGYQRKYDALNGKKPAPRAPAKPASRSGNAKVAVGGAVEIRVKADKDTNASLGKMASRNPSVPMVGKVQTA